MTRYVIEETYTIVKRFEVVLQDGLSDRDVREWRESLTGEEQSDYLANETEEFEHFSIVHKPPMEGDPELLLYRCPTCHKYETFTPAYVASHRPYCDADFMFMDRLGPTV